MAPLFHRAAIINKQPTNRVPPA